MQQQSISCIVLIGDALFNIVNTFNSEWFQWQYDGLQRITHFSDEKSAIPMLKQLCSENYKVIVIWDRPSGTGEQLNRPAFKDIVMLFRNSFPIESDHLLCSPDGWLESTWQEWNENIQPVLTPLPQTPAFRERYTRAMQHWVFSLCLADQLKFDRLLNKDVSDIWKLVNDVPQEESCKLDENSDIEEILLYLNRRRADLFERTNTKKVISLDAFRNKRAEKIINDTQVWEEYSESLKEAASSNNSFDLEEIEPNTWEWKEVELELTLFYFKKFHSFEIELIIKDISMIGYQYELNILVDDTKVVDRKIEINAKSMSFELPIITDEISLKYDPKIRILLIEINE